MKHLVVSDWTFFEVGCRNSNLPPPFCLGVGVEKLSGLSCLVTGLGLGHKTPTAEGHLEEEGGTVRPRRIQTDRACASHSVSFWRGLLCPLRFLHDWPYFQHPYVQWNLHEKPPDGENQDSLNIWRFLEDQRAWPLYPLPCSIHASLHKVICHVLYNEQWL